VARHERIHPRYPWTYLDITALGRQEEWEDSPEGYPPDPALHVRKPTKPGGGGGGGDGTSRTCVRYQADLSGETGGSLILVPC
jgi:hypothetical protein